MAEHPGVDRPKVSVVLAVYNIEGKTTRGLDNMLEQDFDSYEIVVVDDGSTDGTHSILQSYAARDSRVRIVSVTPNLGLAGALNFGVSQSRAEIIMRMDIDDSGPVSRMSKQYEYLMAHPDVDVVSSAFERVDSSGKRIDVVTLPLDHASISRRLSLASLGLCHAGSMIRKNCFYRLGFYNPHFKRFQDYELWLRWRPHAVFANMPEILFTNHIADCYQWGRMRKFDYWRMYRYDFLARYLNFPHSDAKLLDFLGWLTIQVHYFAFKPARWLVVMIMKGLQRKWSGIRPSSLQEAQ